MSHGDFGQSSGCERKAQRYWTLCVEKRRPNVDGQVRGGGGLQMNGE